MKKIFNNLHFRSKIIWIFGIMFFLTTAISGVSYYKYTSHDIEENFRVSAESVLVQIVDTLDMRLGVIRQRSQGMLTNYTFVVTFSDYLNNPSDINLVKAMGTVSSFLKDLEMGESLLHSSYIYTDKGEFDNFARIRNWQFDFKESEYYKFYMEEPGKAIQWFPPQKDRIFQDTDEIIPCVRKFSVHGYEGGLYLVLQLKAMQLEHLLKGKYEFFDKILILDQEGNTIIGSEGTDPAELVALAGKREGTGTVITSDYQYEGNTYLVTCAGLSENGWKIWGLKSRETLLGSLQNLRNVILETMGVIFLLGVAAILLLSHQLTDSLRKLEKRMSLVEKGNFNTRFFYPYKDEVGSLAKSFNYMIGEIQSLVVKQEETIKELKWERDYAAEVEKQNRKAELRALQAQINPHFLYNTLNAITWQAADQGAEEISILSSSLGKFFRISLSKGAEVIPLREELEHVTSYLDIQRIRYHSKLNYQIDVGELWLDCKVIKLILQPLAENSIYHGIKEKQGTGLIRIYEEPPCSGEEQILRLVVWDDGAGISQDKLKVLNEALKKGETDRSEGYGIYNVNERLRLFFGKDYGLQFESVQGQWTKAILTLPVRDWGID
ncbi:MAG: histidine kinase [Lacrimispora sp.]|uniref:cache domain-containing sensor histidine kinase n=1 Tax=Lacrimispora sp. TaxID=2719234 RepID=UPI0039E565EA